MTIDVQTECRGREIPEELHEEGDAKVRFAMPVKQLELIKSLLLTHMRIS